MSQNDLLYVWASDTAKNSNACSYYRITVPFKTMEEMGLCHRYIDSGDRPRYDIRAMISSDVCQFYSLGGASILHQVESLKAINPAVRPQGDATFPPVCVYDLDDNTDFVHPMNHTFAHLGVRSYPDARLLRPGEQLQVEWPDGKRETLWDDQYTENDGTVFDIERNLDAMKTRHQLIRACHGVTVSTPDLASYMKEVVRQPNVYVFPNSINIKDYGSYNLVRENPDEVRVFWQGSMSHWVDWYPLKDAVKIISQKYPNVKWVMWGSRFNWVHDVIPDHQIEHHGWQEYAAYKLRRGLMNIDINLCPLAKNAFNRCKSAIKWYEASIWNKPEATLASNVPPYSREMVDGETGLLYNTPEEFVTKLSTLIEDAQLRKRLGENAKKWVLDNRSVEQTVPALHAYFHELKLEQKSKLKPKVVISSPADLKKLLSAPR